MKSIQQLWCLFAQHNMLGWEKPSTYLSRFWPYLQLFWQLSEDTRGVTYNKVHCSYTSLTTVCEWYQKILFKSMQWPSIWHEATHHLPICQAFGNFYSSSNSFFKISEKTPDIFICSSVLTYFLVSMLRSAAEDNTTWKKIPLLECICKHPDFSCNLGT